MTINDIYGSYIEIYRDKYGIVERHEDLTEYYSIINDFYYDSFGTKLDINKKEDKEKLFKFANDCFRYNLLNDTLNVSYSMLIRHRGYMESDLLNRLQEALEIIDNSTRIFAYAATKEEIPLSKMSDAEKEINFRDFLMFVDPEGDYIRKYDEMIRKGNIVYLDTLPKKEKLKILSEIHVGEKYNNFFYVDDYGVGRIYLTRTGTIEDFKALAHEFAHYLSYDEKRGLEHDPSIVANEYPSFFYEAMALIYLKELGYPEKEINNLNELKFKYIYNSGADLSLLNGYLRQFIANKFNVSNEDDIRFRREVIADFIDRYGEEAFNSVIKDNPDFKDPEKMAHKYCDVANVTLFNNPGAYLILYQYVLGNHFAVESVKRCDEDMLKYVKNITLNLQDADINGLFDKFKPINKDKKKKRDN